MINAQIVCDSVSPNGVRLTTFVATFHRFVLAEMNTHRVFSRNSASSRAIPAAKIMRRVENDIAWPVHWGAEKPGMQSGEALDRQDEEKAVSSWQFASADALDTAKNLLDIGLHKSLVNRLLEPYMWHTAIITAVDFDNFFWQRCDEAAQPEMKAVADAMQLAYFKSQPNPLPTVTGWHLPFISEEELDGLHLEACKQISVARCARVSYLQHDGTRDFRKDIELYDKLVKGSHWSPFEHVATPCTHAKAIWQFNQHNHAEPALQVTCKMAGNFGTGWHQYRKFFGNENRTGFVPNLPELQGGAE